jgi:hypothetical protein
MYNGIKNNIKSVVPILSNSNMVTNLGYVIRSPIDKDGKWIGWTNAEVEEHLSACRASRPIQPHKEEHQKPIKVDNNNCGRG